MHKLIGVILVSFFFIAAAGTVTPQDKKSCGSKESNCCSEKTEKVSSVKAWNKVCPVMGGEVDPEAKTAEYNGKVYGFCCNGCDGKFKKDPAKYTVNLSEDGTKFTSK